MKRAAIFLNGDKVAKKRVEDNLKKSDFIIAADGGVRHVFELGLVPDLVIGDNDSTPKVLKQNLLKNRVEILGFPTDKDQTDSELALSYAQKKGFDELIIFGATGDRLDHLLVTFLFAIFHTEKSAIKILTSTQDIYLLQNSKLVIKGRKGDYVSLVPFTPSAKITTEGLKYKLENQKLELGKTIGVSNELTGKNGKIKVEGGKILLIHTVS